MPNYRELKALNTIMAVVEEAEGWLGAVDPEQGHGLDETRTIVESVTGRPFIGHPHAFRGSRSRTPMVGRGITRLTRSLPIINKSRKRHRGDEPELSSSPRRRPRRVWGPKAPANPRLPRRRKQTAPSPPHHRPRHDWGGLAGGDE